MAEYPRWAIEDYPEAMKDFSDWMFKAIWSATWGGKEGKLDSEEAIYRAKAEVKVQAMARTMHVEDIAERALAYQLWMANKDGWYVTLPAEYSTLYELLSQMMEELPEESGSKYSDLLFLIEQFMPAMERAGIDPMKLMSIPSNWSRARVLVPQLRQAVAKDDTKKVIELLELMVESPSVSALRSKLQQKRTNGNNVPPVIESFVLRDETWFLVRVSARSGSGIGRINRMLGKLADVSVGDLRDLMNRVAGLLKKG